MLTIAASVGSGILNGSSRLFFGWLLDRTTFKNIFGTLTLIALLNQFTMYWAAWHPGLYFTCIMINYMYLGGLFAVFPPMV